MLLAVVDHAGLAAHARAERLGAELAARRPQLLKLKAEAAEKRAIRELVDEHKLLHSAAARADALGAKGLLGAAPTRARARDVRGRTPLHAACSTLEGFRATAVVAALLAAAPEAELDEEDEEEEDDDDEDADGARARARARGGGGVRDRRRRRRRGRRARGRTRGRARARSRAWLRDARGRTPLHAACVSGDDLAVKLVVRAGGGALACAEDANGKVPLEHAPSARRDPGARERLWAILRAEAPSAVARVEARFAAREFVAKLRRSPSSRPRQPPQLGRGPPDHEDRPGALPLHPAEVPARRQRAEAPGRQEEGAQVRSRGRGRPWGLGRVKRALGVHVGVPRVRCDGPSAANWRSGPLP